jgi:hypothetical protein
MFRRYRFLGITPEKRFSLLIFPVAAKNPVHLLPTVAEPLGPSKHQEVVQNARKRTYDIYKAGRSHVVDVIVWAGKKDGG